MNKDEFIRLATRCLANEADEKDESLLKTIIHQQPEYQDLFHWLKTEWNNTYTHSKNKTTFDVKKNKQKVIAKIRLVEQGFNFENASTLRPKRMKYMGIAAAILLLITVLGAIYLLNRNTQTQQKEIVWIEVKTKAGEKREIYLDDSTKITLNAQSTLKYPLSFSDTIREVFLIGEAFLEVTPNPHQPFIIHSQAINTRVLGTKFNVKAYPQEADVEISLIEGEVLVKDTTSKDKKGVFLHPAQQLVYDKATQSSIQRKFNVQRVLDWKEDALIFEDETLENVAIKIERQYGVQIIFENPALKKCKLTGKYQKENLQIILEAIKFISKNNITYEIKNKTITLRGKPY
jgi:transmembrane sensor